MRAPLPPPPRTPTGLSLVIEGAELDRARALHVPGMKELVRADGFRGARILRQRLSRHTDRGRVEMLEAAPAAGDEDERVILVRRPGKNADGGRGDAAQH